MENSIHTPLFQSEEFTRLITEEIIRHSENVKGFEKPVIWMPLLNPFSTVSSFELYFTNILIIFLAFFPTGKSNAHSQVISTQKEYSSSIPEAN